MKFGVRECADMVFKAKSAVKIGSHTFSRMEPVLYLDTCKTSTLETSSTTVYAQGGRGNSRLLAWEGEKVLTFTVEDALISDVGLAVLTGADLLYADGDKTPVISHATSTLVAPGEATADVTTITLPKTNTYDTGDVFVMLLDANGEMSGVPVKATSVAKGVVTIATGLVKGGDTILVDYYVKNDTDALQIDITPDKFAGYYYVEASTLFRRQMDGVDLPAEIVIPKVKIQSSLNFTMSSSGDPSTFTFTMDAFPDYTQFDKTKKVLCSIQVIGADDNYDANTETETEAAVTRHVYNKDGGAYFGSVKKTNDDDAE